MDEFEDGDAPSTEELVACKICGRSFFPKVLKKHTPICQKAAAKKRKVFDSGRQRAEGTEISTLKPVKPRAEPPKKPSNWRQKHEEFIAAMRAAKGLNQVMKDGGPLPPPPPPVIDPDYVQCQYCGRRFNESAAERHIKFCKEQSARMGNKAKPAADIKKTPVRTQGRPLAVKKVSSPSVTAVPSSTSATTRLPQRSGSGQSSGIPPSKVPSAGPGRSISSGYGSSLSGLTSPPSGVGRGRSSGYGPAKNTASMAGLNKRTGYNYQNSRNDELDSCGTLTKFCHECGTKYPVEVAKFCCECGVRRMCI